MIVLHHEPLSAQERPWCSHRLVVDDRRRVYEKGRGEAWEEAWRRCLTCGYSYQRSKLLLRLRRGIEGRAEKAWSEVKAIMLRHEREGAREND